MDTESIIWLLRQPEHYYDGDGFPEETVFSSSRIVLELDHDQDKLYTAILKTIPKETLAEIAKELRHEPDVAASLMRKIEWMSEDHPKKGSVKNETLAFLLKLYLDKKSKKVRYARQCLKDRFDKQSYRDQNRILRAFLEGAAIDCDWVGRLLRDDWRKELKSQVGEAWLRTRRPMLAYVILKHFPNSYILSEQESLSEVSGYQFVCARIGNEPGFVLDELRLTIPNLLYVMAKLGRVVDSEAMEKRIYDFLLNYDGYYDHGFLTPSFSFIPGWDRMVWAMGVLGMQDALVRLLEFENKVKDTLRDEGVGFEDKWPYFVTVIKEGIDPQGFDNRLETEIRLFKDKVYTPESGLFSNAVNDEDAAQRIIGVEDSDDYEQRAWYFRDELSKNPFMTLQEEWLLFVESFFYDRPRLHALSQKASFSDDMLFHYIEIPVQNNMQEEWLRAGVLDEIKNTFEKLCNYPRNEYDIILVKTEDFETI